MAHILDRLNDWVRYEFPEQPPTFLRESSERVIGIFNLEVVLTIHVNDRRVIVTPQNYSITAQTIYYFVVRTLSASIENFHHLSTDLDPWSVKFTDLPDYTETDNYDAGVTR